MLTRSGDRHTYFVHNYKGNMFIFQHAVLAVDMPFILLMKFLAISRRMGFCLFVYVVICFFKTKRNLEKFIFLHLVFNSFFFFNTVGW